VEKRESGRFGKCSFAWGNSWSGARCASDPQSFYWEEDLPTPPWESYTGNMDFPSGTYILAQVLALLSMVVSAWSQQCKKREKLLIFFIIANLLNGGQFLLLGALTGAVMSIIGAVRFGVSIFSTNKLWLALFLVINTVATYLVFEGYILSGTSYLAATFIIISTFLKSDHWMRVAIIIGSSAWFVYGILVASPMFAISSAIFLASSITGWYRHVYLRGSVPIRASV